jgi:hypothetical protein
MELSIPSNTAIPKGFLSFPLPPPILPLKFLSLSTTYSLNTSSTNTMLIHHICMSPMEKEGTENVGVSVCC